MSRRSITMRPDRSLERKNREGISSSARAMTARRRRWCAVYAVVLAAVFAPAAAADHVDSMYKTTNFNPNCSGATLFGNFCQTDNSALTVYRTPSINAQGQSNIAAALVYYNNTNLNVSYPANPTYTGSDETDIIYESRADVPGTALAWTWCDDAVSTTRCDQHYTAFRSSQPSVNNACHETGHAVGLTHGGNAAPQIPDDDSSLGCMRIPSTVPLGAHNVALINSTYP